MIKVTDIRCNNTLLPDQPGLYEWWFLESDAKEMLKPVCSYIDTSKIKKKSFEGNTYWALYFGQAKKESIKERIVCHIDQKHSPSEIKSGFLSTLRQTISSLLQIDESKSIDAVNRVMDNAYICVEVLDVSKIDEAEKTAISTGYYPLNIRENTAVDKNLLDELTKLRKQYKK